VPLAKQSGMIEYLSPDRANQPFSGGILAWRRRGRRSVSNAHRAKPPDEWLAICAIAVTNDVIRCDLAVAGLRQLLSSPLSRRIYGNVQPHDSAAKMPQATAAGVPGILSSA